MDYQYRNSPSYVYWFHILLIHNSLAQQFKLAPATSASATHNHVQRLAHWGVFSAFLMVGSVAVVVVVVMMVVVVVMVMVRYIIKI